MKSNTQGSHMQSRFLCRDTGRGESGDFAKRVSRSMRPSTTEQQLTPPHQLGTIDQSELIRPLENRAVRERRVFKTRWWLMSCTLQWAVVGRVLAIASLGVLPAQLTAQDPEFFEKKVRPALIEHCFECHSGDAQESGLHVDSLAALLTGGERGPAIVPGQPNEGTFIPAIRHDDTLQMPLNKKLPQAVIADLTQWIQDGAHWPDAEPALTPPRPITAERLPTDEDRQFWAFQPPHAISVPRVADATAWARTPIDQFILQKLESVQLAPNAVADKRTLIRRATLALIGIPPTPDEVHAFLADHSPQAFERVVDRLLTSPHYGERWGRHWLDVARYGDSNGLDENLAYGNAWRYRDYVVEAFNADRPYDEFIREQIAGDLLPPSSDEAVQLRRVVATGFLSLGSKMLAEDDPVKMEMDIIDEQLDTLGKAVMGLTLGCARCHDHKFDPISAHDYYALAGIFKSSKTMDNFGVVARWQERPVALPAIVAQRDHQLAVAAAMQAAITQRVQLETNRMRTEARSQLAAYLLAADHQLRHDESLQTAQPIAEDVTRRTASDCVLLEAEDYARGNALKDTIHYGVGIGVLLNGGELPNFTEYDIEIKQSGHYQIDLRYAAAAARPTSIMLDGKPIKTDAAGQVTGGWTPESQRWFVEAVTELTAGKHMIRLENAGPFPHIDKLCLAPATSIGEDQVFVESPPSVTLLPLIVSQWVTFLKAQREVIDGPFSLWWHLQSQGVLDDFAGDPTPLNAMLLAEPQPTTLAQLAQRYQDLVLLSEAAELAPLQELIGASKGPFSLDDLPETALSEATVAELKTLREKQAEVENSIPVIAEAMSITDGTPQNLRVHLRGSHTTLGEEVARRMPHILAQGDEPPIDAATSGRLQLAQWLTRPNHPLTARVLVNRVWLAHFGDGLVRSPDNFGKLGEAPTHPELLDWLAHEFVQSGWSIKSLHRLILNSAVWQQSTHWNESTAAIDPENRWLWRMNRRRLEAEAIRDSLLAIGGDLDTAMGGSLLPTENRGYVTSTANINIEVYNSSRRTLYLPIVRSAIFDYLTAFDFGDPSAMNGQRDRTTVAPQALFLMNSGLVAKESETLSRTLLTLPGEDTGRISLAFERFYSRLPTESEVASSLEFIAAYEKQLGDRGTTADQLRPMAWKAFCRALMSTNEFLYVN